MKKCYNALNAVGFGASFYCVSNINKGVERSM